MKRISLIIILAAALAGCANHDWKEGLYDGFRIRHSVIYPAEPNQGNLPDYAQYLKYRRGPGKVNAQ